MTLPSMLDKSTRIGAGWGAVTLGVTPAEYCRGLPVSTGHAAIFAEFVEGGRRQIVRCDLVAEKDGKIDSDFGGPRTQDIQPSEWHENFIQCGKERLAWAKRVQQRSATWPVKFANIQALIANVKQEVKAYGELITSSQRAKWFSLFGCEDSSEYVRVPPWGAAVSKVSTMRKAHNCFTWARKQLAVAGIYLSEETSWRPINTIGGSCLADKRMVKIRLKRLDRSYRPVDITQYIHKEMKGRYKKYWRVASRVEFELSEDHVVVFNESDTEPGQRTRIDIRPEIKKQVALLEKAISNVAKLFPDLRKGFQIDFPQRGMNCMEQYTVWFRTKKEKEAFRVRCRRIEGQVPLLPKDLSDVAKELPDLREVFQDDFLKNGMKCMEQYTALFHTEAERDKFRAGCGDIAAKYCMPQE